MTIFVKAVSAVRCVVAVKMQVVCAYDWHSLLRCRRLPDSEGFVGDRLIEIDLSEWESEAGAAKERAFHQASQSSFV